MVSLGKTLLMYFRLNAFPKDKDTNVFYSKERSSFMEDILLLTHLMEMFKYRSMGKPNKNLNQPLPTQVL